MGTGIHNDLKQRLLAAHQNGMCLIPNSPSDARRLRKACHREDLVSPASGVFALPEYWAQLTPYARERHKLRSLATLHPDWVFASTSAAVLHGLYVSRRMLGEVHIATSRRSHSRSTSGIVRHVVTNDTPVRVDDAWATSITRTTFDCLRTYDFRAALAIADSALRFHIPSKDSLLDALREFGNRYTSSQRALEIAVFADERSENGGESTARAVMIEQGFMIPSLQVEISDPVNPGSTYRVDFFWELASGNVAGELDGREKYYNPAMTNGRDAVDILADERLRESRLTGANVKVMRFSFTDVQNTRKFCHLLYSFGIPHNYLVPTVAMRKAKVPRLRTDWA